MDLNLLRVFDAVVRTGSVTGAAERLHLTTPATSRALTRLRGAVGDEIMVRAGRGLVPTPYAVRTAPLVRRLLEDADLLVGDREAADPAQWDRVFTIRISDGLAPVVAPSLIARAAVEAPNVQLRFVTEGLEDLEPLRDGTVDLDVGVGGTTAADIRAQPLLADRYVAVVAASTRFAAGWSLDAFCALPHVTASRRNRAFGPIDTALAEVGRHRRVAATVPTLPTAAILALQGDLIAPLPELLANHLRRVGLPLAVHLIPLQLPALRIEQHWHRRLDSDLPTRWLRSAVAAALGPDGPSDG